jgi:hypothetical protein
MIQMIHWFTKNQNYENPETMSMLDTFMVWGFSFESESCLILFVYRMV